MVYRPKIDDKLCFVLMPFGHPFDSYYEKIIKPAALDAGLAALRSDEIRGRRAIVRDIWERIWAARVVVADVTRQNPNVNYELGLCDALGVPTIIIAGAIGDVPFDYKHRRCIIYDKEEAGWDDKLRSALTETIRFVLAETPGEDELEWPYDTRELEKEKSVGVLIASADFRRVVIQGASRVRDAIASAFGPHGAAVAISQAFGGTIEAHRGAQIARGIKSSNPLEEKGIEQIRNAAFSVYDTVGDFTKLVSILASGFMTRGQDLIDKGFHPKDVLRSFERAVQAASKYVFGIKKPAGDTDILSIGTTASGGDRRIGQLVYEAVKRAGKDGVITVETSELSETSLEVHEGMKFDRGYLSDYFITNPERLECVLENSLILCYQGRIQSMKDLLPLLEQAAKCDKSLLIIADDVEGEALATLTVNKLRGTLRCAAVRAPGEGDRRKAIMEDIAILTGGKFLSTELGVPLAGLRLEDLGKAERVVVTQHATTIVGGAGSSEALKERIRTIQLQIYNAVNSFEREKLQERLARVVGAVAVLRAGGVSETDVSRERYKLESAMSSTRAALEGGWIPGGGLALFCASQVLRREKQATGLDDEALQAVAAVLEEPIRQLIGNAKQSPTQVLAEIIKSDCLVCGFNSESGEVEDLVKAGVLDPVEPVELCLRVALSHAGSVLQTGTWDLSPSPRRSKSAWLEN